jgi:hypothetical protein
MNRVVSLHLRHRIVWLVSTSASGDDYITTLRGKKRKFGQYIIRKYFYKPTRLHYVTKQNITHGCQRIG